VVERDRPAVGRHPVDPVDAGSGDDARLESEADVRLFAERDVRTKLERDRRVARAVSAGGRGRDDQESRAGQE